MSKGKGRMGGIPGGKGNMLKQIQKMQQDMVEAQEALANETIDVSVGGGALTITISGHQRVQGISINPEAIDQEDEEWLADLQDLLVAGINQAIEQSQTMAAQRMEGITGGMAGMGLGDMLGLSRSRLLIASGSTFSMWGSYLGQVPAIWHPKKLLQHVLLQHPEREVEWAPGENMPDWVGEILRGRSFSGLRQG